MLTMNLWMHPSQYKMNSPASDVISPRFVEVSEWFCAELLSAVLDGAVLLICPCAALLDYGTEALGRGGLDLHVGVVYAGGDFCPELEVGDPGLVGFDFAGWVEFEEGDLGV